jgi:UDP-N-acetylmuramyl pentapeptide synthase
MKAAIATLLNFKGEKIAVLGDMAELGSNTKAFHQEIGVCHFQVLFFPNLA